MADFNALWAGGPLFAQAEHFRLSTDSVLLADFVNTSGARRGMDLGCASGAIALLLLWREPRLHMTGLELLPPAAALAAENMERNALSERCAIVAGDIRRHRELFRPGAFDLVVANPPYYPAASGAVPPDPGRAAARGEGSCTLADIVAAAAWLCRTGGSFSLVHKPERMAELFCRMSAAGVEPKRLRLVCATVGAAPSLILVEGRRGGRPGLRVEPPLVLKNPDGTDTDEVKRIYNL